MLARLESNAPHVWDKPGLSRDLVCLVHLVSLVQPTKPDRPNRPNEQDRLADLFSIQLDMEHPQWGRISDNLDHVLRNCFHRQPVETVPIGTGIINTFFASRHIGTQDQPLAERLPTRRKIVAPRIEQADIRNTAGSRNMGRACGSGDHRMTRRNHCHQLAQ